ncbi:hypothetical protein T05_11789 [Trichinella murrelli]|uniref:Uncharacterized protein n=2 Tax=Trichinella murrelli TaxID=144512 RepID=A0A0V0T1M4_9BILA|nr:hypothetical protein T05_11789 [Trichinella murrelli]
MTNGLRDCRGKLYTNLDATKLIQTCEHADGRRVDPHTLYRQLNELKQLVAGDLTSVTEIYDDLANNASTSLDTGAYFPSWDQAQNTMYYGRSFVRLIIDEQGKSESVVQQMDDGYTRETGFVRSSAAYGVQE